MQLKKRQIYFSVSFIIGKASGKFSLKQFEYSVKPLSNGCDISMQLRAIFWRENVATV